MPRPLVEGEARRASATERRERPLTNSQIAIGIMNGIEALVKANRLGREAAVAALFDPNGFTDFSFEIYHGGNWQVDLSNERNEDGTATRELTIEMVERDTYDMPELIVGVTHDKNFKEKGFLKNGSGLGKTASVQSARERGKELLDALNYGQVVLSASHMWYPRTEHWFHKVDFIDIPREEDTPRREEVINGLYGKVGEALRNSKSEDGYRARRARQEIAVFAAAALELGAGYLFKGFVDTPERFEEASRHALEVQVFDGTRGVQTLSPVAYLEIPVITPHGKLLTQIDAFIEKDGLSLYRTGKDGIDWTTRIDPTDVQVLQLQQNALDRITDSLIQIRPSVRQRRRKEEAIYQASRG